jgi:hypothetical protein
MVWMELSSGLVYLEKPHSPGGNTWCHLRNVEVIRCHKMFIVRAEKALNTLSDCYASFIGMRPLSVNFVV